MREKLANAGPDRWIARLAARQHGVVSVAQLLAAGLTYEAIRRDPVVPPVNLKRIAAQMPGAQLEVFPGAHAFLFQTRAAFTDAVDQFLGW